MHNEMIHPVPAVAAIILRGDRILLVKRGHEPGAGQWSIPGGSVEIGEMLEEALKREVMEETGLKVEISGFAGLYELIIRQSGEIQFHYIILDYFATANEGEPVAASDAAECRWVPLPEVSTYNVTKSLMECLLANKLISVES